MNNLFHGKIFMLKSTAFFLHVKWLSFFDSVNYSFWSSENAYSFSLIQFIFNYAHTVYCSHFIIVAMHELGWLGAAWTCIPFGLHEKAPRLEIFNACEPQRQHIKSNYKPNYHCLHHRNTLNGFSRFVCGRAGATRHLTSNPTLMLKPCLYLYIYVMPCHASVRHVVICT